MLTGLYCLSMDTYIFLDLLPKASKENPEKSGLQSGKNFSQTGYNKLWTSSPFFKT